MPNTAKTRRNKFRLAKSKSPGLVSRGFFIVTFMRKKIFFGAIAFILLLVIVVVILVIKAPKPPTSELKMALEALSNAQKANAQIYAGESYKQAQIAYDSAMNYWAKENDRLLVFRDYSEVNSWVAIVLEKAEEAQKLSGKRSKSTSNRIKEGIVKLDKKVAIFDLYYKRMPLSPAILKAHNKGVMKLSETRHAFENNRFSEAEKHFNEAWELINSAGDKAEILVQNWFSAHNEWQKQAKQAVQLSANNKKVILVDKFAHTCTVFQNKKAIRTFDVEFGINWMGDKLVKGDKATPEGIYKVTDKKSGAKTKFHKALLINYPNEEDQAKFAKAKNKKLISANADIGGLIEFHGMGGKGIDWTDGCIALTNKDMDTLYNLINKGTTVIIVGSVQPLESIIKDSVLK